MLAGDTIGNQIEPGPSSGGHITELELETALFKSMTQTRPAGRHKHFQIISVQTVILHRTGLLIPTDDLWSRLGGLYNLEALDDLSSTSTTSSTSSSPVRTRPRKSSFQLPLFAADEHDEDEQAYKESWRTVVLQNGRQEASPEAQERDRRDWSRGVKRQTGARSRSRGGSSSLSEQGDEEEASTKRKRESTGSASTTKTKKARGGSVKPRGRPRK